MVMTVLLFLHHMILTTDNVLSLQVEGIMKFGSSAELEPDTPDGKLMDLDSISSIQLARHVRLDY